MWTVMSATETNENPCSDSSSVEQKHRINSVHHRATKAAAYYHNNVAEMNNNGAIDHQFKRPGAGYYLSGTQTHQATPTQEPLRVGVSSSSHDAYYKAKLREGFVDLRNSYNNEKNGKFSQPSPRGGSGYLPRSNPVPETPPKQGRSDYLYTYDSSNDGQSSGSNRSAENVRGGNVYRSNSQLDLDHGDYIEDTYLRRHYGSTNSLDVMNAPNDSFFDMLKEYKTDNIDQRAPPPPQIHDVLRGKVDAPQSMSQRLTQTNGSVPAAQGETPVERAASPRLLRDKGKNKDKESAKKPRAKTVTGDSGLLRKLRGTKSDPAADTSSKGSDNSTDGGGGAGIDEYIRRKALVHYDCQSIAVSLHDVIKARINLHKRRNTTTGASAASSRFANNGENSDTDDSDSGDGRSNELVQSCSFFRNEIGGEEEKIVALTRRTAQKRVQNILGTKPLNAQTLMRTPNCGGIAILDTSPSLNGEVVPSLLRHNGYIFEHVDLGAYYYRNFFYNYDHQNYFGIDENIGPVAVSVRREKTDERDCNAVKAEGGGVSHHYRLIIRTSELTTIRGAVTEDAIPSSTRLSNSRGVPAKDLLEYIAPQIDLSCLRLATSGMKTSEQLLKLDEQGITNTYKIGVMYCRAGQNTEEEMYNNESAGHAFEEFLDLIGQRVRLKGFDKYRAGLDNKTDTTGSHSIYNTVGNNEIMFHVSTLLPYTPNNRQQLLRKRHIGNDIVTIVFQEPDSLPFTPISVRSHFQHVFIIVRVYNPGTEHVRYSIAVTRSKDVPAFGPSIPENYRFRKSPEFVSFLLTKVINGENAAHKSEKFMAMATRTRQEYLKDLATNFVTSTSLDSGSKLSKLTFGSGRKKDKASRKTIPDIYANGSLVWIVQVEDFSQSNKINCFLGISSETIVVIEEDSGEVVFTTPCKSIIGWSSQTNSLRLYYDRGEYIIMKTSHTEIDDIQEITSRLTIVTQGCETVEMTLRRNGLGQLGFHVIHEGLVSEVEPYGFAWQAGLRQGSRLVEICKVATATLTQDQIVDLLRTSVIVKVVVIPPLEDGLPRRGSEDPYSSWSSLATSTSTENYQNDEELVCMSRQTADSSPGFKVSNYKEINSIEQPGPNAGIHIMHARQSSGHSSQGSQSPRPQQPYPPIRGWQKNYPREPPQPPSSDTESYDRNLAHNTGTGSSGYHSDSGSAFTSSAFNTPVHPSHTGSAFNPVPQRGAPSNPPGLPPRPDYGLYRSTEAISTGSGSQASTPSKRLQSPRGKPSSYAQHRGRHHREGSSPASSRSSSPRSSVRASNESLTSRLRPGVSTFSKNAKPLPSSNFQEELMRLIDPDVSEAELRHKSKQPFEGRKPQLQRTLSEESIRDFSTLHKRSLHLDAQFGNDVIFTTAVPARVRQYDKERGPGSSPRGHGHDHPRRKTTEVSMPLPDPSADMDWSNLVNAATKAIEGIDLSSKINSKTLGDMPDIRSASLTKPTKHEMPPSRTTKTPSKLPISSAVWKPSATNTSQRLVELEERCTHLQQQLDQERHEKLQLSSEVDRLKHDNVRLQEESQRAAAQLRRFTEWFFQTIDKQ